jgi:murein DD-endopeptidase MepM/ murein hydrolase activator NlpD
MIRPNALFVVVVLLAFGCNGLKTLKNNLDGLPPYEKYVRDLEKANLQSRPMVKRWIEAGQLALKDSLVVQLPFSETGHFIAHKPDARSYQFEARDGQVITVNGALKVTTGAKIFADLFLWKENEWKNVAWSDSTLTLSYEFTRDAKCLLRIQPELLVNAYYSIALSLTPILINPVSGADNRSIRSFYGDSRDGGKRSHEGVDIFAKKGTPIVAPTKGRISRVGTSRLGGKVVWMYDQTRGHSYYFAHLDSQYVSSGQFVKQGDVIGTVGNTGNARYTPPHLHFGIYQSGSKDPLNYIKTLEAIANVSAVDTTFSSNPFKIGVAKSALRRTPDVKAEEMTMLQRDTFVEILAESKDFYRIALADLSEGFVLKQDVINADKGKSQITKERTPLMTGIHNDVTVIAMIEANTPIEMLALYGDFKLVRTSDGVQGWIQ